VYSYSDSLKSEFQSEGKCYTFGTDPYESEVEEFMTRNTALRAVMAFLMFVLGNLQAWDSNVPEAGLLVVLLVSLAIPLAPMASLLPVNQQYLGGALMLEFVLLLLARLISPIPLPGLFIVLLPAGMGLIFTGFVKQEA
jgi:hypothetical protein